MRTIEQKNRLIAEFMRMQLTDIGWFDNEEVLKLSHTMDNTFDELLFHISWDWLMPVLKKISSILFSEFSSSVSNQWIMIESPTKYNIENVHEQAFQFIEWYNKQK